MSKIEILNFLRWVGRPGRTDIIPLPYQFVCTKKELKSLGYNKFAVVRTHFHIGEIELNNRAEKHAADNPVDKRFNDFDSNLFDHIGSPFWSFSLGYRPAHEDLAALRKGYDEFLLKRLAPMTLKAWLDKVDAKNKEDQIDYNLYLPFPKIIGWHPQTVEPKTRTSIDPAEEQRLAGFINASIAFRALSQGFCHAASVTTSRPKYTGEFVYCPSCNKWDVSGVTRTRCNLCGSDIEYVASNRWKCKGTYIQIKDFQQTVMVVANLRALQRTSALGGAMRH
jgi:hypothetical protein